jgi:hypothetical protein
MTSADTTAPKPGPESNSDRPAAVPETVPELAPDTVATVAATPGSKIGSTSVRPKGPETRADKFLREVGALKIPDPAAARNQLWLRTGAALMVLGLVLGVSAYFMSHGTSDELVQNDAITIALLGVGSAVVGAALFLRYSLTGFLRFWMARQSFDLATLGDRLFERSIRDLTDNDPATR